jgi:hypothetical protein
MRVVLQEVVNIYKTEILGMIMSVKWIDHPTSSLVVDDAFWKRVRPRLTGRRLISTDIWLVGELFSGLSR